MTLEEIYNIISENVKYYRMNNLKYGYITQEKLSRVSTVSLSIIRNIESQKKNCIINLVALNNIAQSLEIPLYKFFIKVKEL